MEGIHSFKKDTLVAFRIAANDIDFFKQMVDDHYKMGEIKTQTLAALSKYLLYSRYKMCKDLEKVQMLTAQRSQPSYTNTSEEPRGWSNVNDHHHSNNYNYPESTSPKISNSSYTNEMRLQNQREDNEDNDDGNVLKRPFFYEVYPNWYGKDIKRRDEKRTR